MNIVRSITRGSFSPLATPVEKIKPRVAVLGAGAVGANVALLNDQLGLRTTLIDPHGLLHGSSAAHIAHKDGYEYHRKDHEQTGFACVQGGIAKSMLWKAQHFDTGICTADRPIRFFVSNSSEKEGLSKESFYAHAEKMRGHYAEHYNAIVGARGQAYADSIGLCASEHFGAPLDMQKETDVADVAFGYAGYGCSVHMGMYYASIKAALQKSSVSLCLATPLSIRKNGGVHRIETDRGSIEAEFLVLTAGHSNRKLWDMLPGDKLPLQKGTDYLNCMVQLSLPPTGDPQLLKALSRVNFILQGDDGDAYTGICPPTATLSGRAVTYFPSMQGSQIEQSTRDENSRPIPARWDALIKNGIPINSERAARILAQAVNHYPFLKNYAKIESILCRPVFNVDDEDSHMGLDRRVRRLVSAQQVAHNVWTHAAPKWTNCELGAFSVVQKILEAASMPGLPICANGFGPEGFDLVEITKHLNFRDVMPSFADAVWYTEQQGLPNHVLRNHCPDNRR
jgi:hypothetical protein